MSDEHVYTGLGGKTIINAAGSQTRLGGTIMLPEVVEAMAQAARHFVTPEPAN